MTKLLIILLFLAALLPASAYAETEAPERVITADIKASELKIRDDDCRIVNNENVCTYILYHYEMDEQGRLYFKETTAYGVKDSEAPLQTGSSVSTFICQLNSALHCDQPELRDPLLDLGAYAVTEQGVNVHSRLNAWVDAQKATLFLPRIRENADAAIKTRTQAHDHMVDNLVCFMFDFAALTSEYKLNGHLIENESVRLAKPDACLPSFQDICSDSGSRKDQLQLAANSRVADPNTSRAFSITAKDIDKFCKSLKPTKSAMLR